jgi:AAHS family benzoate transporter-like MFS transporter
MRLPTRSVVLVSQRTRPAARSGPAQAGAVGALFRGWVLASGIGFEWHFYGFAVPALPGALFIGLVPRRRSDTTQPRAATAARTTNAGPKEETTV